MNKEYGILWTDGIYLKEIPKKRKPYNTRYDKLQKLAESKGLSFERLDCDIIDGHKYSVRSNSMEGLFRTLDEVESYILFNEEEYK